ncbi:MAG: TQO small subunit DoxD [Mycobacteriales bacterium]
MDTDERASMPTRKQDTAEEPLDSSRRARVALATLRVGVGLMWVQNAGWKRPPHFGADGDPVSGLRKFTGYAVEHPVFPPYAWVVDNVVLPHFTIFGWLVLLAEASIGAFLLVGLGTRLWAVIGLLQSLAITLSVLNAPHEWHWSYFLMLLAHGALWATAAGRAFGLDGALRPHWRRSPGRLAAILMRLS